jgi:hypothetical protein
MNISTYLLKGSYEPVSSLLGGARGGVDGWGGATSRQVVGSSHEKVIEFFFNLPNSSSRTMALGFTQFLTEINTTNVPGD